jgi:hypothetical protein
MCSFGGSVAIAWIGAVLCHSDGGETGSFAAAANHIEGGKSVRSQVA